MKVGREFNFDASHFLPEYKGKCERVHGHTYRLKVVVEGEPNERGIVMDFNELKDAVNDAVMERLDHGNLNEIFENPTAENIAEWIFKELEKKIPVSSVKLYEGLGKWVLIEK